MIAKKHVTHDRRLILALCDRDIIGKKFSENEAILDLTVDFYKGEELSEKEIERLMKAAYLINIAGKKSVALAKKLKLAEEKHIITIQKIPHAQILVVRE